MTVQRDSLHPVLGVGSPLFYFVRECSCAVIVWPCPMGHGSSPKGLLVPNLGYRESLFLFFEGSFFFMEDMFSTMIDLLGKGVLAAGSLLAVWGANLRRPRLKGF